MIQVIDYHKMYGETMAVRGLSFQVPAGAILGLVGANRHAVYHAMDLNFRLKATSKAKDAGVVIPTVNDGFTGQAPDLGALESGKPGPTYGPRWLKKQPFYR